MEKNLMSAAQRKALDRHRARQAKRGLCRVEVTLPEGDKSAIRQLAALLRAGDTRAERLRLTLEQVLNDSRPASFAELLESAPLEDVELHRNRELPRDIEL